MQPPCREVRLLAAPEVLVLLPSFGQQISVRTDQLSLLADDYADKALKLVLARRLATGAIGFKVGLAASHFLPHRVRVAYQRYGHSNQFRREVVQPLHRSLPLRAIMPLGR